MPVTLTDEQVAQINARLANEERNRQLAERATYAWNHPEHGGDTKALWKKIWPNEPIEGYDSEQRMRAMIEARDKERLEAEKAENDRRVDDDIATKRRATMEKHKYSEDEMKELEDMMTKRGVIDYEVAGDWMASKRPSPSTSDGAYDQQFWHHETTPHYKEIAVDPERWGRREIEKTFRDIAARGDR